LRFKREEIQKYLIGKLRQRRNINSFCCLTVVVGTKENHIKGNRIELFERLLEDNSDKFLTWNLYNFELSK